MRQTATTFRENRRGERREKRRKERREVIRKVTYTNI
jgi:hypothetical protein